ncbi:MAG: 4-hydroxy-tetrahydrodipicolinate reductase [Fimbriimonadaceae bacterium]|nr:4-hydroxy-tetrahydrodipicolinate reductase [Fimbriimonadaceae bacterium]
MNRVVVVGASGRMGTEATRTLEADPRFEVAALVDQQLTDDLSALPAKAQSLQAIVGATTVDTMLELTHAESAIRHAEASLTNGIACVIGASGLLPADIARLSDVSRSSHTPGIWVPNFSIGAVLMMQFAEQAAKWFPAVEILELHHDQKQDAPSGTALRTAQMIAAARSHVPDDPTRDIKAEGARGAQVDDVRVHSVRLPGYLAHQAVLFGGAGEALTIRHDSTSRASFMEGIKLCLDKVRSLDGFLVGMEHLLNN